MPTYYSGGYQVHVSSDKPTEEELERLTIPQLLILAKMKRGFKRVLINFLKGE